jgi:hypothetical protein
MQDHSQLSVNTRMTLKQSLFMTTPQINNAWDSFVLDGLYCESDFIICCARSFKPPTPCLPADWVPPSDKVDRIPSTILKEYLGTFHTQFKDLPVEADITEMYHEHCRFAWDMDCRNNRTRLQSIMRRDWQPKESTKDRILSRMCERTLNMMVGEFKLYWVEANVPRANWDEKLLGFSVNYSVYQQSD